MDRRQYLAGFGTALAIGFAGCGGTGGGDGAASPTDTSSPTDAGAENRVRMVTDDAGFYFDPIGLFVERGTTVTWVNVSGAHSSTAYVEGTGGAAETRIPENADGWNSETIAEQGATFEHTFDVAGTYDYFCIPHKANGMVGRVVVGQPGGPAEESPIPDGTVPESDRIVEAGAIGYDEFTG